MKKFFKKTAAWLTSTMVLSGCLYAMPMMSASAYSTTRTIDNDSIASGYGNTNRGFSYIKATSLYNGDARISTTSVQSPRYEWSYPLVSSNGSNATISVQAYLNHKNFTDTASYYVEYVQNTSIKIGSINQNKAPAGWSKITRSSIKPSTGMKGYSSTSAEVYPSGASGKYTGADGLKVSIVIS